LTQRVLFIESLKEIIEDTNLSTYTVVNWTSMQLLLIPDTSSFIRSHNCLLEHSKSAFNTRHTLFYYYIGRAILAAENSRFKSGFVQLNDIDQIFLLITTV